MQVKMVVLIRLIKLINFFSFFMIMCMNIGWDTKDEYFINFYIRVIYCFFKTGEFYLYSYVCLLLTFGLTINMYYIFFNDKLFGVNSIGTSFVFGSLILLFTDGFASPGVNSLYLYILLSLILFHFVFNSSLWLIKKKHSQ